MKTKRERLQDGTFKRLLHEWSLDNFECARKHPKSGRYLVYLPHHPRAHKGSGLIHRSIAAYEAYHGVRVPRNMDVHHINHDRTDDSIGNLELVDHREHGILHNEHKKRGKNVKCIGCGKKIYVPGWRQKDGRPGVACGNHSCRGVAKWRHHNKFETKKCPVCEKPFKNRTNKRLANQTCGRACASKLSWSARRSNQCAF